jgi:hypothetical protein
VKALRPFLTLPILTGLFACTAHAVCRPSHNGCPGARLALAEPSSLRHNAGPARHPHADGVQEVVIDASRVVSHKNISTGDYSVTLLRVLVGDAVVTTPSHPIST